jgi:hypothetical protein
VLVNVFFFEGTAHIFLVLITYYIHLN